MMRQKLSEFMGCESWSKLELCDLIDELHADVKARDGLIRDMFKDKVKEATCLNLETGEWFTHGRDAETIEGWRERMEALGIEVDNDESQGS